MTSRKSACAKRRSPHFPPGLHQQTQRHRAGHRPDRLGQNVTYELYASGSNELNSIEDKLITTEDPVEYDIDGIIQVQIRTEIELTFANALRSILRHDPDIVLVGEIRDKETAVIATQASLTGHLVFSTLHTNDAPSSIARLLDLGVKETLPDHPPLPLKASSPSSTSSAASAPTAKKTYMPTE